MKKEAGEENSFGVASVILGIVSILSAAIPGIILGIIAVIFASKQKKRHSNGWAKAGLILGAIGLVLGVIGLIMLLTNENLVSQLQNAS